MKIRTNKGGHELKRQWFDRGEGEHPRYFRNAPLVHNERVLDKPVDEWGDEETTLLSLRLKWPA